MNHQDNQPRTYADGVTRTTGVPRWERVASLFLPTPGAENREWEDDGSTVEVHCYRHPGTDLSTAPFAIRLDNHETGESAAAVMSSRAAVAVAERILSAVTHGLPEGLTDAEYHGYYYDDDGCQRYHDEDRNGGNGDQPVPAADEHHNGIPGAPGNVLRFPGAAGVDVSDDMDRLVGEVRDHCTTEDGDRDGDDFPGGVA